MGEKNFFETLKLKMDGYAHTVYRISRSFPKDEIYGATSQLRRAALSVILNYIEGYARQKIAVKKNFWEISYGSLKESKYLLHFCYKENYFLETEYREAVQLADEIGAMLWRCLQSIQTNEQTT